MKIGKFNKIIDIIYYLCLNGERIGHESVIFYQYRRFLLFGGHMRVFSRNKVTLHQYYDRDADGRRFYLNHAAFDAPNLTH